MTLASMAASKSSAASKSATGDRSSGGARLTRSQRKRLLVQERAAQRRQAAARRARIRRWSWLAAGLAALTALSLAISFALPALSTSSGGVNPLARQPDPGQRVPDLGNAHVLPGDPMPVYNSDPPTSGPHFSSLPRPGVHIEPVDKRLQVHFLEDGGVIVQYKCAGPEACPELESQLRRIVERYPDKVLLAPYPTMDRMIALTAWTRIDKFDDFDEERIVRFINRWRGIDHHR